MPEGLPPPLNFEEALLRVPPKQAVDFVRGMQNIDRMLEFIHPDVLFIPERGAMPMNWALERFEEQRGSNRFRVILPIGAHLGRGIKRGRQRQSTFDRLAKRQLLEESFSINKDRLDPAAVQSPVLIDEVKSGGSIVCIADLVSRGLRARGYRKLLTVIGVEDSRSKSKKMESYNAILNGSRDDIQIVTQSAPLFTIDNPWLLNRLHLPAETVRPDGKFFPMTEHNIDAKDAIRRIVDLVLDPRRVSETEVENPALRSWYHKVAAVAEPL